MGILSRLQPLGVAMTSTRLIQGLAVLAVAMFALQTFSHNQADVDLWGNVGFVQAWPGSPGFHRVNTFSFTDPDHPWINHEWLGEYCLHSAYAHFGNAGLLALKILLGLALLCLVLTTVRAQGLRGPAQFLFLLLFLSTVGYGFGTRPHLFTYVLYAAFLLILQFWGRTHPGRLLLLPVLMLAWVNLHGAFFIGLLLLAVYLVMETLHRRTDARRVGPELLSRRSPEAEADAQAVAGHEVRSYESRRTPRTAVWLVLGVLGLAVAATFVNPFGAGLWRFVAESAAKPRPYLSEWAPFNLFAHFSDHSDFVALAALSVAALLLSRKPKDPTWLTFLAFSFVAALWLRRNIPLFAITAAFVVPEHLRDVVARYRDSVRLRLPLWLTAAVLALFTVASAWLTCGARKADPLQIEVDQTRFPSDAIAYIQANDIRGNALVFFDWAEFFNWHCYPASRVFLDGRFTDAYSPETVDAYFNFLYRGPGWDRALTQYPVDMVLMHRGASAYEPMLKHEGWVLVYQNAIAGLFLKADRHEATLVKLRAGQGVVPPKQRVTFFPE